MTANSLTFDKAWGKIKPFISKQNVIAHGGHTLMKTFLTLTLILTAICCFGQKSLHNYGGPDHDVYLGCLNCDNYNTNSIWNAYGNYGSEYSSTSPFNAYASYPPVIVDKDGTFYGYFTVNEYKSKRADFKLALIVCKYYASIREDVSEWYDKIFN